MATWHSEQDRRGSQGNGYMSRSLEDLSRLGMRSEVALAGAGGGTGMGMTPVSSLSPADTPSLSPSHSFAGATAGVPLGFGSDAGGLSAALGGRATPPAPGGSTGPSIGSSGFGVGSFVVSGSGGSRQPRLTRKNLAEQLRDYQLRRRTDWATAAFFSATSAVTERRRGPFGSSNSLSGASGSSRRGGVARLLHSRFVLFMLTLAWGVLAIKHFRQWPLLGLILAGLCVLTARMLLRRMWVPQRRSMGTMLPV